jgi:hypothetical protein
MKENESILHTQVCFDFDRPTSVKYKQNSGMNSANE